MPSETQGIKYIGSKSALIPHILKCIDDTLPGSTIQSVLDVFTGTTRVAQAFKARGYKVTTSDLSWASACYSNTWIANPGSNQILQEKITQLNALPGTDGWITQTYCDTKGDQGGTVRVWQAKNGRRADAIRDTIHEWYQNKEISAWENDTLITSLILALDKVDNTVGVQQAYLKDWCTRSHLDLTLELPRSVPGQQGSHISGDCLQIQYEPADLAYLDPPYSSHSYATYYHIWDSIARWDKPAVGLNTNRRVDRVSGHASFDSSMTSRWNSKKTAAASFDALIQRLPVKWVLVSYNNESLVDIETLEALFAKYPCVLTTKVDYKRNIMCQIGNASKDDSSKKTQNVEYLYLIQK